MKIIENTISEDKVTMKAAFTLNTIDHLITKDCTSDTLILALNAEQLINDVFGFDIDKVTLIFDKNGKNHIILIEPRYEDLLLEPWTDRVVFTVEERALISRYIYNEFDKMYA